MADYSELVERLCRFAGNPLIDETADAIQSLQAENARLEARVKELEGALKKSAEGWENAVELGLLPSQHTMSARILGQNARQALEDANK